MHQKELLEQTKAESQSWYKGYLSAHVKNKNTLVATMSVYPNPLLPWDSVYPMEKSYDTASKIVSAYYENRGIDCIITGPIGLGATGGFEFGLLISWIVEHKDLINYIPPLYKFGKRLFQNYRNYKNEKSVRLIRSTRPKIKLDLCLYLEKTHSDIDPVPYVQQLVLSYVDLFKELSNNLDYVAFHPIFTVVVMNEDRVFVVDLTENPDFKHVNQVVKALIKVSSSSEAIRMQYKNRSIGRKIIVDKKKWY